MATATQALETSQPQKLQTKFTVELSPELAVSLHQWFERAGEAGDINSFFAQVSELPIIEFRLDDLPPSEEERTLAREKMTAIRREELLELFDDGETNSAVLAERFSISRSTVRRLLNDRDASTGIVRMKKRRLDEQQLQEIQRLSRDGLGRADIAKRFDRTESRIQQILRGNR